MNNKYNNLFVLTFLLLFMMIQCAYGEVLKMAVWEGYTPNDQIEIFKKMVKSKYNMSLEIKIKYVNAPEDFFRILRSQSADLISPSHNLIKDPRYKMIEGKITLPIDIKNVPNYKDIIPDLQYADSCSEGEQTYSVPFVYGPYALAYNENLINEAPDSWKVLWSPEYSGKYCVSKDYPEVNFYITGLALGIEKEKLGDVINVTSHEVATKLDYLYKNAKSLWGGIDTADDLQGMHIATTWGFCQNELNKRKGEKWKIVTPVEGLTGYVDGFMISHTLKDKPTLKKIAEEWINHTISPEFQINNVLRQLSAYPVNLAIKDQISEKEIKEYHLDNQNYFKDNMILWPTLSSRARQEIKKISNRILK